MESYEYKLLSDGKNKVKLTKTEMTKAAALSIERNNKNQIKVAEFGEDDIYKISNKKLKAAGKNLLESRFPVRICQQPSRKIVLVMLIEKEWNCSCKYCKH